MDLHPEDLLEREIRGELSAAEEERLELHSRQCAVCRLERRARADFLKDSESPEAEADVARLLAAMAGPLALQGLQRPQPRSSPMRYIRFVAAAAAVVSVTGFAAAAGWSGMRAVILPWAAPAPASAPAAQQTAAAPAPRRPVARPVAPAAPAEPPAVPEPSEPVAQPATDVAPTPAVVAAPAIVAPRRVAAVAAPKPLEAAVAPAPADDATLDAATMFRRANEARQSGDHLRAGELYGLLLNRYPGTPEAHASLALFGRMLLDDGNANGALQCFDDYLRKGGALREDVMLGRALAFQRIGPRAMADEGRAWASLLDAYPGSVHAERARRRLSEIERL